jgi:hypothetical protein
MNYPDYDRVKAKEMVALPDGTDAARLNRAV